MSPRWWNAVWLAGLALVVGSATCSVAPQLSRTPTELLAWTQLGLDLFLVLLAFALATPSGRPRARLGLGPGRIGAADLALLTVGMLGLSWALDATLELTGLREVSSLAELDLLIVGLRGGTLALAVASLALGPALGEELLCRGLIQRGLELRLGPGLAIPLAAVLFGAIHVDPIHAAAAAVLGIYLGLVAWLAGSIRASIGCHVVNNAVAIVAGAYEAELPVPAAVLPLGFLLAAGAVAWVWRRVGRPPALLWQAVRDLPPEPAAPAPEGPAPSQPD